MISRKYKRYLGLDVSLSPGFAVIDVSARGRPKLVAAEAVTTTARDNDSARYSYVEAKTSMLAFEYGSFAEIIREDYQTSRSKRARQAVFGAWAAVDVGLGRHGYKVTAHITPTEVKRLVGGDGRADKDAVANGVRRLLRLDDGYEFASDDASDAAAVALAWLIREGRI